MATDPLEDAVRAAEEEGAKLRADTPTDTPRRRRRTNAQMDAAREAGDAAPKRPRQSQSIASLERRVTQQVIEIGLVVSLADQYDGTVIAANGERLAKAWCKVAEENKAVRRFLEGGLEGSAWLGAAAATLAVAVPILAHHNLIPGMPAMFAPAGVTPDDGEPDDA